MQKHYLLAGSAATRWPDLFCDVGTKVQSQPTQEYPMISLMGGILKNDINELIYKTEIDSQI